MRVENPNKIADADILEEFRRIWGLPATVDEFRKAALDGGSPSVLCREWAEQFGLKDPKKNSCMEHRLSNGKDI